jgi:hypothetical protein
MWKEAWAARVVTTDQDCVGESMTSKRKAGEGVSKKGVKLDLDEGVVWGGICSAEEGERRTFLYSVLTQENIVPAKQMLIKLLSGQEWL